MPTDATSCTAAAKPSIDPLAGVQPDQVRMMMRELVLAARSFSHIAVWDADTDREEFESAMQRLDAALLPFEDVR